MTILELKNKLESTGYPVAYSHFNEYIEAPFITYREVGSDNFNADNNTYHDVKDFDIEVYTTIKDLMVELAVESILKDNEIPYEVYETYIDSEKLFQKVYEVRLL